MAPFIFIVLLLALFTQLSPGESATFTIINSCDYTIWPGILSNAGVSPLPTTGFSLDKGESRAITTPSNWGGRFWGRTLCSTDPSTGTFTCRTGDCGSGKLDCSGAAAAPATLAEFTLAGSGGMDFYDVSLVDGYNLAMSVAPRGGGGPNCSVIGCVGDLNGFCPADLRVMSEDGGGGKAVACRSACDAFDKAEYCCREEYGSPDTCGPSRYSTVFKRACPRAYSYAYDDKSSTFTCRGSPDYTITFCPSPSTSQKASSSESGGSSSSDVPPVYDSSMVYEGAMDEDASSPNSRVLTLQLIAGALTILLLLQLF